MSYRRHVPYLWFYALGYFVILEAMLVAAVLYWPEFDQNRGAIRVLMSSIPAASEILDQMESAGSYGYVAMQHFFKGCNTLGSAGAILFASGAIAGEAHRGTLEILLARPIPRWRTLLERYLAGFAAFAVPIVVSSLTIPWLCTFVDTEIALSTVLLGSLHEVAFLSVVHAVTFFLSVRGDNPIRIALTVIFGALLSFALYFVKTVSSYSPFRLTDVDEFLRIKDTQTLDPTRAVPLLAITLCFYVAAHRSFQRRLP